jgi:hypothetical protein
MLLTSVLPFAPALAWTESVGSVEVGRTSPLPAGNYSHSGTRAMVGGPVQPASVVDCVTSAQTTDSPGNPHGAVSKQMFVATTTSEVSVYRRNNCPFIGSRVTVAAFFAVGFPDAADDSFVEPRVIYDFGSARFLVAARAFAQGDQILYFAVSTSATAAAWRFFRIRIINATRNRCVGPGVVGISDVSIGVQASRWLFTMNANGGVIMSLEKQPTLDGGNPRFKCFRGVTTFLQPPIVRGNPAQAFFLSAQFNTIERWRLAVAAAVPDDSLTDTSPIDIPAWTIPPNAPQPNGQNLATGNGSFGSASIQFGAFLWNVHTINVNGQARWRLYKLSAAGTTPLLTFTPNTAPGIHHNFNASVATGPTGPTHASAPAFVTFSRTRPGNPNGRAETVMAKGPSSTPFGWSFTTIRRSPMQFEFAIQDVTTCNDFFNNACRWGTYSATQVDPSDPSTAWGFNQLAKGTSQRDWVTHAAAFN